VAGIRRTPALARGVGIRLTRILVVIAEPERGAIAAYGPSDALEYRRRPGGGRDRTGGGRRGGLRPRCRRHDEAREDQQARETGRHVRRNSISFVRWAFRRIPLCWGLPTSPVCRCSLLSSEEQRQRVHHPDARDLEPGLEGDPVRRRPSPTGASGPKNAEVAVAAPTWTRPSRDASPPAVTPSPGVRNTAPSCTPGVALNCAPSVARRCVVETLPSAPTATARKVGRRDHLTEAPSRAPAAETGIGPPPEGSAPGIRRRRSTHAGNGVSSDPAAHRDVIATMSAPTVARSAAARGDCCRA
jgi:hypothetical protein